MGQGQSEGQTFKQVFYIIHVGRNLWRLVFGELDFLLEIPELEEKHILEFKAFFGYKCFFQFVRKMNLSYGTIYSGKAVFRLFFPEDIPVIPQDCRE